MKRVFIVGCPRSGTTWMMWLLAQHSAVAAIKQAGLFHALLPLKTWWQQNHKYTTGDGTEKGDGVYRLAGSKRLLTMEDFFATCRPLCELVFDRIAQQNPGAQVIVEQTPENLRQAETVRGIFPDAYFLHVIRDPRAVYVSMRSAAESWSGPRGFSRNPVSIARLWREFVQRGRALAAGTERYFEVRYEDLSADPVRHLQRIHEWLGLATNAAECERAVEACRIEKLRERTAAPRGFFRRGSAGGWREEISRSELRVVEHVTGEEMAALGYERLLPPQLSQPLRERLHDAAARSLAWAEGLRVLAPTRRFFQRLAREAEVMKGSGGGAPPPL